MRQAQPGERQRASAREYNTSLEVNEAWRRGQLIPPGPGPSAWGDDSNKVWIRNDTGGARERGDIVGLGDPLFLPSDNLTEFMRAVTLKGEMPTAAHFGKLAMLIEPVAQNKLARAVLAGCWPTIVYVDHEAHEWATYVGNDQFRSDWYGDTRILWKDSGLGEQPAYVQLGVSFLGPIDGMTTETIEVGSSGDVLIYDGEAPAEPDSLRAAHLVWTHGNQEILANTQVSLFYSLKRECLVIRHANCEVG